MVGSGLWPCRDTDQGNAHQKRPRFMRSARYGENGARKVTWNVCTEIRESF